MQCLGLGPPCSTGRFLYLWLVVFVGLANSTHLCLTIVINWISVFSLCCIVSAIMRAEHFMYFCIKNFTGTQVEDLLTKSDLHPPTPSGSFCYWSSWCYSYFVCLWSLMFHMSPAKRICVFKHSVMTNFNCACPAIQRGQGSGFLSEGSSWLTICMSEQRRFWRDCADAQARLNLRCSHMR